MLYINNLQYSTRDASTDGSYASPLIYDRSRLMREAGEEYSSLYMQRTSSIRGHLEREKPAQCAERLRRARIKARRDREALVDQSRFSSPRIFLFFFISFRDAPLFAARASMLLRRRRRRCDSPPTNERRVQQASSFAPSRQLNRDHARMHAPPCESRRDALRCVRII